MSPQKISTIIISLYKKYLNKNITKYISFYAKKNFKAIKVHVSFDR